MGTPNYPSIDDLEEKAPAGLVLTPQLFLWWQRLLHCPVPRECS